MTPEALLPPHNTASALGFASRVLWFVLHIPEVSHNGAKKNLGPETMLGARRTLATHVPDDGRPERARRTRPRAFATHVLLAAIAVIPVGAKKSVESPTSQHSAPAPPLSFEREMLAGAVARAAAQCCMYPADVMKTLAQVAPFPAPVPGCRAQLV